MGERGHNRRVKADALGTAGGSPPGPRAGATGLAGRGRCRRDAVGAHIALAAADTATARALAGRAVAAAVRAGAPDVECEALEVMGRTGSSQAERTGVFERIAATAERHAIPHWRIRALHETALTTWGPAGRRRVAEVRRLAVDAGALVSRNPARAGRRPHGTARRHCGDGLTWPAPWRSSTSRRSRRSAVPRPGRSRPPRTTGSRRCCAPCPATRGTGRPTASAGASVTSSRTSSVPPRASCRRGSRGGSCAGRGRHGRGAGCSRSSTPSTRCRSATAATCPSPSWWNASPRWRRARPGCGPGCRGRCGRDAGARRRRRRDPGPVRAW